MITGRATGEGAAEVLARHREYWCFCQPADGFLGGRKSSGIVGTYNRRLIWTLSRCVCMPLKVLLPTVFLQEFLRFVHVATAYPTRDTALFNSYRKVRNRPEADI
jgi:hypothetical protein